MITLLVALNCFNVIMLTLDSLKYEGGDLFEAPKFEGTLTHRYE
jgi:hypothetical protein